MIERRMLNLLYILEYSSVDDAPASKPVSSQSNPTNTPTVQTSQTQLNDNAFDTADVISQNSVPSEKASDKDIYAVIHSSQRSVTSNDEASRKRKAREVFGDIDDLDDFFLDDSITTQKSKKSKEEEELEMIEHIIHLRKMAKDSQNIGRLNVDNRQRNRNRDKNNISSEVPRYPFIGVTTLDKDRIYIRFHSEQYEEEEMDRLVKDLSFSGLLGDTYKEVWQEANVLVCSGF